MRARPFVVAALAALASGCSLLGFYDEAPTTCPDDIACCSAGEPLAHGGCDWTCNDPAAPELRLAAMRVEPDAPVATLLRAALEGAVGTGGLTWLFDLEGEGTFHTGEGDCDAEGACSFVDAEPLAGASTLGRDGQLAVPASGTFDVDMGLDSPELGPGVVLPLRDCSLVGAVEPGGNCMGRRASQAAGDWSTPGRLSCAISANGAREVDLPGVNLTLCDLLAGCGELSCCDDVAPRDWPNATDVMVLGFPAWSVRADVAAIGVRIGD